MWIRCLTWWWDITDATKQLMEGVAVMPADSDLGAGTDIGLAAPEGGLAVPCMYKHVHILCRGMH